MTPEERAGVAEAARIEGLDASSWARRVLRAAAAERMTRVPEAREAEPTDEEIATALAARGSVKGKEARHLRQTVERTREEWA